MKLRTVAQISVLAGCLLWLGGWADQALASPFGQGVFGADVPFGSATSLSISLGGDVTFNLTLGGSTLSGNGSHTLTVTSTDVVGYSLYLHALGSTSMSDSSASIPASGNTSDAPLAANTWGYNTTGSSTNFTGITASSALIKNATGPFESGDTTTITYGILANVAQAAGTYSASVVYTAVAQNP
jgi:hypothetical protein